MIFMFATDPEAGTGDGLPDTTASASAVAWSPYWLATGTFVEVTVDACG